MISLEKLDCVKILQLPILGSQFLNPGKDPDENLREILNQKIEDLLRWPGDDWLKE